MPYIATPYEPATIDLLHRVDRIFQELVRISPDERTSDNRTTLLALFTSLSMEHFRALVLLVESQVAVGSAFTLLRPLLESIARGEWLYLCGTEEDRNSFIKGELKFKGLRQVAEEVDLKAGVGQWIGNYSSSYAHLCDFTHGGVLAVGLRLTSLGSIEPNYQESRIRLLLEHAARMLVLHFAIISLVDGDDVLAEKFSGLFALLR